MVIGWRRAFCTSVPKERETKMAAAAAAADKQQKQLCDKDSNRSPRLSSKLGFFSNPSTPRLQSQPVSSPSLRCRTTASSSSSVPNSPKKKPTTTAKSSPRLFSLSDPSPSPKSPSSFSLLKASLRLSKVRCGICLQSVKSGQGAAIFTAECSHAFHFPCIATHVKKNNHLLTCPVCNCQWSQVPIWSQPPPSKNFRVYDDDEPLASPISLAHFNPIPESDEEELNQSHFQGFSVAASTPPSNVQTTLLPEAAVLAVSRTYETYALLMKVKAPPYAMVGGMRRAPVDLVAVVDVSLSMSGVKLQMMKRAIRLVISSLGSPDRLSIVAFSAASKRLLPLRRMTANGRRSARRIVDAIGTTGQGMTASDALKKAVKVLEDRRERNPVAAIILLSESSNQDRSSPVVSSTRITRSDIPVHSIGFNESGACNHAPHDDLFAKCVGGLLNVVVQDLELQLGFMSGSGPAEIAAVYSLTGSLAALGSGSIRIGDLYAEEERELLIELKVPTSSTGSRHVLAVRSSFKDPSSQDLICSIEQPMLAPRPQAVRSSSPSIARLRNLHVTTRAVAESRRLIEVNDLSGAYHLLSSARALLIQASSGSAEDYLRGLDAELAELHRLRQQSQTQRQRINGQVEDKPEPLTPTSAWRAAERLAKVAITRKHMNRVSDLHGFENARF